MKLMNESDYVASIEVNDKVLVDFDGSKVFSKFDEEHKIIYLYITDKESKNPVKIIIKNRNQNENT